MHKCAEGGNRMLSSIQNNVSMTQNQMAFRARNKNIIDVIRSGNTPLSVVFNIPMSLGEPSQRSLQLDREDLLNKIAKLLEKLENSEVGKTIKDIVDRCNKKEISVDDAQKMIREQLELIG